MLPSADAWQGTVLGVLCVAGAKGRSSFCIAHLPWFQQVFREGPGNSDHPGSHPA